MNAAKQQTRGRTAGGVGVEDPEENLPVKVKLRRLNIALTEQAYNDAEVLGVETNRSMTEVVRLALGIFKVIVKAYKNGQQVIITGGDKPDREIVIPGLY